MSCGAGVWLFFLFISGAAVGVGSRRFCLLKENSPNKSSVNSTNGFRHFILEILTRRNYCSLKGHVTNNLEQQVECFTYICDIFHMSTGERACKRWIFNKTGRVHFIRLRKYSLAVTELQSLQWSSSAHHCFQESCLNPGLFLLWGHWLVLSYAQQKPLKGLKQFRRALFKVDLCDYIIKNSAARPPAEDWDTQGGLARAGSTLPLPLISKSYSLPVCPLK